MLSNKSGYICQEPSFAHGLCPSLASKLGTAAAVVKNFDAKILYFLKPRQIFFLNGVVTEILRVCFHVHYKKYK